MKDDLKNKAVLEGRVGAAAERVRLGRELRLDDSPWIDGQWFKCGLYGNWNPPKFSFADAVLRSIIDYCFHRS